MNKSLPTLLLASLMTGCITMPPPPNRSAVDPADSAAGEAAAPRYRPNLIAGTRIFLDPSVGEGAQKMDHSKMGGMGGMEGMDHSKMQGMEGMGHSKMKGPGDVPGMDHSKMPGMKEDKPQSMENMPGMDHSKMPGMDGKKDEAMPGMKPNAEQPPADKAATVEEMKKTADEMKKTSDELKAKSDALAKKRGKKPGATPAPEDGKPDDHSQHKP